MDIFLIFKKTIACSLVLSLLTLSVGCSQKKNIDMHNTNTDRDVTVILESEDEGTGDATDNNKMGWQFWAIIGSIVGYGLLAFLLVPRPVDYGDSVQDADGDTPE